MKRVTLRHSARILIASPTAGCCERVVPLTVAAVIVWFLGCIPAQAACVILFREVVEIRRWLREWKEYWAGWREDIGLMWLALTMTMRLEFA